MQKLIIATMITALISGCATVDPYSGEQKTAKATSGALIGTLAGAVLGAATASKKDRKKGALIGAGIGAIAGGGAGYYMDVQDAKLRQKLQGTGVSVSRVGNNIVLNMPGSITFSTGSADLNANFFRVLDSVILVLQEYEKTLINVDGHTDSVGSDQNNQALPERRASTVAEYLISGGVAVERIAVTGFGERRPVASNSSKQGKSQNRRVEIILEPIT
jgi:outer membrane protein OmpA-like peptidoglycan-associated protein